MTLLIALTIAALFGVGTFLMLKRDLINVGAGIIMLSNGSILFVMASALQVGSAPIYPLPEQAIISDPLVQALALTAIVISFGITALLLSIIYRTALDHGSVGQDELVAQERQEQAAVEADEPAYEEELA
jgi:multicomponent Na+:H+ antiporter subunit C